MHGLALWLLLLSIFTHALIPTGSPLHRIAGSAFSASTADVSLAPSRKLFPKQAQLRDADEGNSEGSGFAGPAAIPSAPPTLVPRPLHPASVFRPEATARPGVGGSASFEARAPPSS